MAASNQAPYPSSPPQSRFDRQAASTIQTPPPLPPRTKLEHRDGFDLSVQYVNHLVSIEQQFCKVSSMAMEFLRQEGWTYSYTEVSGTVLLVPPKELYKDRSIFKGEDIQILEQHVQKISAGAILGLITRLSETEITEPWKKYMILLAKTQGYSSSYREWIPCKRRALDMLELHDKIADRFESIQDELDRAGYHYLVEAITEKLKCLARFDFIYNRQPAGHDGQNRTEPTYTVQQVRKRKKDKDIASEHERLVVTAYQQSDRKVPVLVAAALISIILSLVPLVLAWRISGASPGTTSDVDFYLLIQTSIMQLLGLFTTIFPMAKRPASSAWRWANFFTIVGVLVSVAAVPIYFTYRRCGARCDLIQN